MVLKNTGAVLYTREFYTPDAHWHAAVDLAPVMFTSKPQQSHPPGLLPQTIWQYSAISLLLSSPHRNSIMVRSSFPFRASIWDLAQVAKAALTSRPPMNRPPSVLPPPAAAAGPLLPLLPPAAAVLRLAAGAAAAALRDAAGAAAAGRAARGTAGAALEDEQLGHVVLEAQLVEVDEALLDCGRGPTGQTAWSRAE